MHNTRPQVEIRPKEKEEREKQTDSAIDAKTHKATKPTSKETIEEDVCRILHDSLFISSHFVSSFRLEFC